MPTTPEPYCKSAIFTCTCCSYATTIYSPTEWLPVTENPSCDKCNGNCDKMDDQGMIFRDDIDEEFPLHTQMCLMPDDKQHCDNSVHHDSRIHWTELLVNCPNCKDDTMRFTKYTQGKNILAFYEECVNNSKLAHQPMQWIDEKGNSLIHLNGPGTDFSST